MRFFCDNDVDVAVARMLRQRHHEVWTAADAGLQAAGDDDLTVYAQDSDAVLLTHDLEFSRRRRHNVTGKHILLRCNEWDAADLLDRHLEQILRLFSSFDDIYAAVSKKGMETSHLWE